MKEVNALPWTYQRAEGDAPGRTPGNRKTRAFEEVFAMATALTHAILAGPPRNPRLDEAAAGGKPIRELPTQVDDPDAVRRIQKALKALGFSMTRSFERGQNGEPDGRYGDETFSAVQAFQAQAFPNDRQQVDGRVGQNTLAKLDAALLKGGGGGGAEPTKTFIDIVVRFKGGRPTGENLDQIVTEGMDLGNYNRRVRTLATIGRGSVSIREDARGLITEVMGKIREKLSLPGFGRGVICIYGSSAGGRNALELAQQLNAEGHPIAYLGVLDAPFFPDETSTTPDRDAVPTNVPLFDKVGMGSIRADVKLNSFQTRGNRARRRLRPPFDLIWTSLFKVNGKVNEEIHGDIPGFKSDERRIFGLPDDNAAHDEAIDAALPDHQRNIASVLTKQTPLPPPL
jgi:hypothetical protein